MRKTAILFPGQGAQYPGMGKRLYHSSQVAREVIDEAGEALGTDLKKFIFEGSAAELRQTEIAQPAILATSVAAFRHYLQDGRFPLPQYMAGHSLGEYTALCCAGALGLDKAVRLVQQRGRLMQEAIGQHEGDMAAVNGMPAAEIEKRCARNENTGHHSHPGHRNYSSDHSNSDHHSYPGHHSHPGPGVWISAYNLNGQVVISGYRQSVSEAAASLQAQGAEVIHLKVSAPFHTPLMADAAERLREILSSCRIDPLHCTVLSNVTGLPYASGEEIVEGLYRQMVQPVQWLHSLQYLYRSGVYYFIDAGPRKLLRNQLTGEGWPIEAYALEEEEDANAFHASVSDHIGSVTTPVNKALALAVSAKNYNYDELSYEGSVLGPYRKIKQLQERAELEKRLPLRKEIGEACRSLQELLKGKLLPAHEIQEQYDRLCRGTGALLVCPELKSVDPEFKAEYI
jgi:[acyl-carrier-protein] S-malonyltransferase